MRVSEYTGASFLYVLCGHFGESGTVYFVTSYRKKDNEFPVHAEQFPRYC